MADILLADDVANIREGLALELETEGYSVRTARNGEEVLAAYGRQKPDLLILDVKMPKMSGFSACTEIRRTDPSTPILFLTALDGDADAIRGLGLGADDYIPKTCGRDVLLARVKAALRRVAATTETLDEVRLGKALVSFNRNVITVDGKEHPQYPRAMRILRLLVDHRGETMSRAAIFAALGERGAGYAHAMTQCVSGLKTVLASAGVTVTSVYGVGYRLEK